MWNFDEMSLEDLTEALEDALTVMTERYQEARAGEACSYIKDPRERECFEAGRALGYFETLDTLRSRILINGGQMDEVPPLV